MAWSEIDFVVFVLFEMPKNKTRNLLIFVIHELFFNSVSLYLSNHV